MNTRYVFTTNTPSHSENHFGVIDTAQSGKNAGLGGGKLTVYASLPSGRQCAGMTADEALAAIKQLLEHGYVPDDDAATSCDRCHASPPVELL